MRRRRRKAAAVTEMSYCLMVFVTVTMGMMDLGVGVFRSHVLAQAARQGARRAVVHGELASQLGSWGPNTIDVTANATGIPIVNGVDDGIQDMLIGCDLDKSRVRVDWLDGDNKVASRVRVTVESPYKPVLTFILGSTEKTLSASSTMRIAH